MKNQIIKIFEKVQDIPYRVCQYEKNKINANLKFGDCRHKHSLLKKLLEKEGFEVKKTNVVFDWKDLPIPRKILNILTSGTVWDHNILQVKINSKWIKVDCTWNLKLKEKGFPITENWDGITDTKQVTEGKLEFFEEEEGSKNTKKTKATKEEVSRFADALNEFLKL